MLKATPFLILSIFLLYPHAEANAATYPGNDWETVSPESVGLDSAKVKAIADYAFTQTKERRTDALIVIRQGKIAYERYEYGYNPQMRHISWSMAKSFTAILMGIAESEGIISRNTKMVDFYPYPAADKTEQDRRNQVTLMSLLTMSSGIDWVEDYSKKSPLKSDVTQMLYMNPRYDMGAYVASRPMESTPNDHYYYSTGNTTLAMAMLRHKMEQDSYDHYPWTRLFNRIGMKNVTFEQDNSGTFGGGSYVYATARDYARFGYLLLNNGRWNDEQVVPSEWMKVIKTVSPGQLTGSQKPGSSVTYGAGFWLNLTAPKWNLTTPYPKAPNDLFFAQGHNGQSIVMIPSLDLVVVRLAHDIDDGIDKGEYYGLISQSVKNGPALPVTDVTPGIKPLPFHTVLQSEVDADLPDPTIKHTSPVYFTKLVASVRAKDFCSCYFVEGQTEEFCKERVKNGFPQIRMRLNESVKQVTFGVLPSQSAERVSEELGCRFL